MKISIIVPVYNVENYISKTLKSIIKQTSTQDLEVIVVDDGSMDNSYLVAKKTLESNEFSSYKIIKKENQGVSAARNTGLDVASGDYVIFLDGDDFVSPNLIQKLKEKMVTNRYDVIFWGYDSVNDDGRKIKDYFASYAIDGHAVLSSEEVLIAQLTNKIKFWTGNLAIKKNILIEHDINYTIGSANGEDQEFIAKVLCNIENALGIEATLSYYLIREGSAIQSNNINRFDSVYSLTRMFDYLEENSKHEIRMFSKKVKKETIIRNYLGNINNSMRYLKKSGNFKRGHIDELFNTINLCYPNIEPTIRNVLTGEGRLKVLTNIQIRILKFSKIFYFYVFRVTDFIRNK